MESAPNPYAAPLTETEASLSSSVEGQENLLAIRAIHINAEASIKAVGALDYFGGAIVLLNAVTTLFPLLSTAFEIGRLVGAIVVMAGIGASCFYLGSKIRELSPGARIAQTVLLVPSVLVAVVFPGALFLSLVIAYVLWSGKARVVFSEHYRKVVIPATPQIKYRSSLLRVIGILR